MLLNAEVLERTPDGARQGWMLPNLCLLAGLAVEAAH
jgi:hypothetical protein